MEDETNETDAWSYAMCLADAAFDALYEEAICHCDLFECNNCGFYVEPQTSMLWFPEYGFVNCGTCPYCREIVA